MKRFASARAALALLMSLLAVFPPSSETRLQVRPSSREALLWASEIPMSLGTEDDPDAQAEMEFLMLRDPRERHDSPRHSPAPVRFRQRPCPKRAR